MDFGLTLNLEQKQSLVMTPQLQMAIELLQFSSQDLEEYVEEEIKANPLLEKDEDNREEEFENRLANQYVTPDYSDAERADDEINYENFISYQPTLLEHLENQLFQVLTDDQYQIGRYIVGNLNQDGFLTLSVEEISQNLKVKKVQVNEVLKKVQRLDPVGIAARSLKETLLIQLDSLALDTRLAEQIVVNYLELLGQSAEDKIIKEMGQDREQLLGAINLIKTLDPRPAARFNQGEKTRYIIPDIIVKNVNGRFVVVMNEKASPVLRINPYYYKLLQEKKNDETYDFLRQKFKAALWLIKSIEQRRMTIYRIAQSIVELQQDFFWRGIKHLHAMTMQDIADQISMHESTVSRATSDKYIQTPQGLFEMKFFFTSGVGNVSSISIKAMIVEYIEKEESSSPLSDQQIVKLLEKREGMSLSRRTVAKYRSELGIPSSVKRKKKK